MRTVATTIERLRGYISVYKHLRGGRDIILLHINMLTLLPLSFCFIYPHRTKCVSSILIAN